jgi:hypothetical protein
MLHFLNIIFALFCADFGDIGEGFSSPCKQVYACHHFIDYGGEAKQAGQVSFKFSPRKY